MSDMGSVHEEEAQHIIPFAEMNKSDPYLFQQ